TVRHKWFDFPQVLYLMLLPAATLAAGSWIWVCLGKSDWKPFAGAVAIYVLAFAGLAYSLLPYVVMDRLTLWDAAAHPSALKFVLVGAVIVLPSIVGYTVYVYRLSGGKTKAGVYEQKGKLGARNGNEEGFAHHVLAGDHFLGAATLLIEDHLRELLQRRARFLDGAAVGIHSGQFLDEADVAVSSFEIHRSEGELPLFHVTS